MVLQSHVCIQVWIAMMVQCAIGESGSVCHIDGIGKSSWNDRSLVQADFRVSRNRRSVEPAPQTSETAPLGLVALTKQWISNGQWRSCVLWLTYAMLALFLSIRTANGQQSAPKQPPSGSARRAAWDFAKLFFMACVVWNHITLPKEPLLWPMLFQAEMPGFTFISGVFAASGVLHRPEETSDLLDHSGTRNSLRDLILVNLTCPLFLFVLKKFWRSLTEGVMPSATVVWSEISHDLAVTALMNIPANVYYWYLPCLFLWRLLAPLLCMLRFPVTIAVVASILLRSSQVNLLFLLPFFVLGFSLGGGGLPSEERAARLQLVEDFLTKTWLRAVVSMFLLAWTVFMTISPMVQGGHLPSYLGDFGRSLIPWSRGGPIADLAYFAFLFVLTLSWLVVCFAMPSFVYDWTSGAGSRTLYVYVLHLLVIGDYGFTHGALKALFNPCGYRCELLVSGVQAVFFTIVLASSLTMKLTHHFVQPQWLIDLLMWPVSVRKPSADVAKMPQLISKASLTTAS